MDFSHFRNHSWLFISVAEPDLHILAEQISSVTSGMISKRSIVGIVSAGIAIMLSIGLIKIVYNFPLYKLLTILYGIIFALTIFTTPEFLAISLTLREQQPAR